jgi:hypothetical protein
MEKPQTTYSPEYIKDRESIDTLSKSMQGQIMQLNKRLTQIQVTDFSLKINQPTNIKTILPFKRRFWLGLIRSLAFIKNSITK